MYLGPLTTQPIIDTVIGEVTVASLIGTIEYYLDDRRYIIGNSLTHYMFQPIGGVLSVG
jgi:hypothetical protein